MAKRRFVDSAKHPILAIDFDDTINVGGTETYPQCGKVRKYAKEVINLLHIIGVKVVVWTSRDVALKQDTKEIYDDLTPMLNFLNSNEIKYDAVNKSVQFAPWHCNSRKAYAHMYVDDRAFGWEDRDDIMLSVLSHFMEVIAGIGKSYWFYDEVLSKIEIGEEISDDTICKLREYVNHWKD